MAGCLPDAAQNGGSAKYLRVGDSLHYVVVAFFYQRFFIRNLEVQNTIKSRNLGDSSRKDETLLGLVGLKKSHSFTKPITAYFKGGLKN